MTAPVPEEENAARDLSEEPPGEHAGDLPDGDDDGRADQLGAEQAQNAESSQDQPSQ